MPSKRQPEKSLQSLPICWRFVMQTDLGPFIVMWSVLAVGVVGLIAWRKALTGHFDNTLKLQDAGAVSQQAIVTHKIDVIDRWGKILTAITVISGLALGLLFAYQTWAKHIAAMKLRGG